MRKLLRKIKKALPSTHEYYQYARNHYYERLSAKYGKIDAYIHLLNNNKKLSPLKSKSQIKPELGCDIETIEKKFGKPFHRLQSMTILKNTILFYKFMMGGQKTKCEMHFFNNKLFLFTYIFSYLTPKDKIEMMELLSKKYLDRPADLKNSKIVDDKGNEISLHNSGDFMVYYLAGQSDFFKEAESIRSNYKNQCDIKAELNTKELLNRL